MQKPICRSVSQGMRVPMERHTTNIITSSANMWGEYYLSVDVFCCMNYSISMLNNGGHGSWWKTAYVWDTLAWYIHWCTELFMFNTHVLRSRLVMNNTISYFPLIVLGYPGIPNDHMDLCQTPCVQVPVFSRHWGHVVNLDQSQALLRKFLVPAAR